MIKISLKKFQIPVIISLDIIKMYNSLRKYCGYKINHIKITFRNNNTKFFLIFNENIIAQWNE